jgi:hypothetical protein
VAGCCEYCDDTPGSGATELVKGVREIIYYHERKS